ncbi:hypothetical protein [Eleftheria terrae]|uniref:hypothetical protein n=1 Tax=Eleftheria terrae TaxID=1597781 RepID=UPI00263A4435|nr:hypothetical protein [Eleftheria terrae]WKB51080.1 hypothetical protein N7L95_14815 [Eleftheria terrae]
MINDLRTLLSGLLEQFEASEGRSPDAYWEAALFQPMAAGKYLSAVTTLVRTGLLKAEVAGRRLRWSLPTLRQAAVPSPGGEGCSWGLGFSWRELPATEPFLITSALVTRGLCDAAAALPQEREVVDLAEQALRGLDSWCTRWLAHDAQTGDAIPAYSPGIRRAIYNAAAVAWSVLLDHRPERQREAAEGLSRLWACRMPGAGWCYEAGNGVVDLLHQAYLFGAMRSVVSADDIEPHMLSTFSQFSASTTWLDVVHVVEHQPLGQIGHRWARHAGAHWLVLDARPARLWSLGELLRVLSEAATAGQSAHWLTRAGGVAADVLRRAGAPGEREMVFGRHTMHLAHGLAAYIAAKRASHQAVDAAVPGAGAGA